MREKMDKIKRGDLLFYHETMPKEYDEQPALSPQDDIYLALTGSGHVRDYGFWALRLTDGRTLQLWDTGRLQWTLLTHYDLPAVV